jgi:hypothetical protein
MNSAKNSRIFVDFGSNAATLRADEPIGGQQNNP